MFTSDALDFLTLSFNSIGSGFAQCTNLKQSICVRFAIGYQRVSSLSEGTVKV